MECPTTQRPEVADFIAKWAEATDYRVKFMASVLRHIKAIKLSAYEPSIARTAVNLRDKEIFRLRKWIKEILIVSIVTNYVSQFLSLLTIVTYTLVSLFANDQGGISTAKVFTVISTIALIANPLRDLGQRVGTILSAWASFKRIESFLQSEEKNGDKPTTQSDIELQNKKITSVEVRISEADFGVRDKITLLHDVNVQMTDPKLWMLVGRVGSVSYFRSRGPHAAIATYKTGQINSSAKSPGRDRPSQGLFRLSTRNSRLLLAGPMATQSVDKGQHHFHVPVRSGLVPKGHQRSGLERRHGYPDRR